VKTSEMNDRYKEKNCKFCEKRHKKRGPYCCQACSNKDREVSDKVRENMRTVAIEHNRTPEAIAQQRLLSTGIASEDFAIDIPEIKDLSDYSEFLGGFDRGEKW